MLNKITKKISGVDKSRDAGVDSEARQLLLDCSEVEEDSLLQIRYDACANCPLLKEEFKLFGVTVKDMTPTCGECGCNLMLKIPMGDMSCPIGEW
jgi:hypothetical protein